MMNTEPQRSFDNLGSSSSDSDEDAFLSEAPPQYYDVVTDPLVPSGQAQQMTLQVSINTGHTDVPAQIVSEPHQPPQPQRQVQTSSHLVYSFSPSLIQ